MANHHLLSFATPAATGPRGFAVLDSGNASDGIVGSAPSLNAVRERLRRVAATDMPVLITGETGTGKELAARAIHQRSRRAARPFIAVNIGALPETLAAAALFGHERGAYTGADRLRLGHFENADRGTLFLDEVGELPADVQVALLRVLQEGEFDRLGGSTRRVDVRLIAATNRDLESAIEDGQFRADLFYRLNVFAIRLPPLRERREDIPLLAHHFAQRAASQLDRSFSGIEPHSLERLQDFSWPGNIRQLQSVIEQSAVLCDDGPLLVAPEALSPPRTPARHSDAVDEISTDRPTLEEVKKRYVTQLLRQTRGNMVRTAAILDVDRRSLYRMVERYQLRRPLTAESDPA